MFCENCGKPNADGARFCEHCGASLNVAEAPVVQAAAAAAATAVAPAAPKVSLMDRVKAIHQKNKLILPIIAAVVVVAIVLTIVLVALGKRVEMTNYLDIKITGSEGYGQLSYDFDEFTFFMRLTGDKSAKNAGDCDPDTLSESEYTSLAAQAQKYSALMESINIEVTYPDGRTRTNLCNGDQLIFKITYDESQAKNLGVTLINEEYTYEVSGLTEPQVFNILDYYEVVFTGYDGYGDYELKCKESIIKNLGAITVETDAESREFEIHIDDGEDSWTNEHSVGVETDKYDLSNGDTVTLIVDYTEADEYIEYGVLFESVTKEVTVSGLQEAEEIDILGNYEVKFTGLDGDGELELIYKEETITVGELEINFANREIYRGQNYVCNFWVNTSDSWGLTNGDEIAITLDYYEDDLAENGIAIINNEMTVTVEGLGHYATELDPIKNASNYSELTEWGETVILDYLYDDWDYAVHNRYGTYTEQSIGEDMAVYKVILTTPKSSSSYEKNTLWLVYSVTLDDNALEEPTVYYFAVKLTNVAIMGDGTIDTSDSSSNKYRGVTDYQEFYDDYIGADEFKMNIFE